MSEKAVTQEGDEMIADIEPHLRTEDEIRELQPRVDFMAQRMCQTQGMVLWALKEAGLTVVLLDPRAREIAPDGAAIAAAEERGRRRGVEGLTDARALLIELRHELLRVDGGPAESIAELPESLRRASTVTRASAAIRALDAALAPRDSAPVCDHVLSSDPFREWRCGKPKGHEGPHSGDRK